MSDRIAEDARLIKASACWPCWPFLPVKRYRERGQGPECGVLFDGESTIKARVFLVNLFDLPALHKSGKSLKDAAKVEYESVADMLADGWMVD